MMTDDFCADSVDRTVLDILSDATNSVQSLLVERDQLRADLAKLQAEREPRDNGDGTVTRLLPVTFPKALNVFEVRPIRPGDLYRALSGIRTATGTSDPCSVYLILRPAPKPPEPVTWEAPLVDGEWIVDEDGWSTNRGHRWHWDITGKSIRGLAKPPILGKYQFGDGVGTLIQEAAHD